MRVLLVHGAPYGAHIAETGKVYGGVVLVRLAESSFRISSAQAG
jgi:hypothetical protein